MGIDLSTLVTGREPPGGMYRQDIRTDISPLAPSFAARPNASIIDDPIRVTMNPVEDANSDWAAGWPARIRAGQILSDSNAFGTRISPINAPEVIRGRMFAVSI